MANRETCPASLFPLRGDLSAEAGAVSVTVVGLQNEPISPVAPELAQSLTFIPPGLWTPTFVGAKIQVNNIPVSDDFDIAVNSPGLHGQVLVNGS